MWVAIALLKLADVIRCKDASRGPTGALTQRLQLSVLLFLLDEDGQTTSE